MRCNKTYSEKISDHIADVARVQCVEDVLHFTRLANLPNILIHGLLSRSALRQAGLGDAVIVSDGDRLDNDEGAISVSISYFYPKMFDAKRYRSGTADWVILGLDPSLLWEQRCLFYAHGAATNATKYERGVGKRDSGFAFESLFWDDGTVRKTNDLPLSCPTHPDSEVQVMEPIPPEFLRGIWVETVENETKVKQHLRCLRVR